MLKTTIYSIVFKCIYFLVVFDWMIRVYVNYSGVHYIFAVGDIYFGFAAAHDHKTAAFIYPIKIFDAEFSVNVGVLIMTALMLTFNYAISNKNIRYTLMCALFVYMAGWLGNVLELFLFGSVTNYIGFSRDGVYFNVRTISDYIIGSFNYVLLFLIFCNAFGYANSKFLSKHRDEGVGG